MRTPSVRAMSFLGVLAASAAHGGVVGVHVQKGTIVPVELLDSISLKNSHEGDRFRAVVKDNGDFPSGTQFDGRVLAIHQPEGKRDASIDLVFDSVSLPDGSLGKVSAVPVTLDKRYVDRDPDGRYRLKRVADNDQATVLGSMAAGLIIGSTIKKPFEGAMVGALIGIIAAGSDSSEKGWVLAKGSKIGVYFQRDFGLEVEASALPPKVEFRGAALTFESGAQPFWRDQVLYLPLESTASSCHLTAETYGEPATILLSSDEDMLRMDEDLRSYRMNGKRGEMPGPVVKNGNVIYVPADAFGFLLGRDFTVNGKPVAQTP